MKKRSACLVALLVLILVLGTALLGACINTRGEIVANLGRFTSSDLTNLIITAQTTDSQLTLTSVYTITADGDAFNVDYIVQHAGTFEIQPETGKYVAPEDKIVSRSGSAVVEHGIVKSDTGNALNIRLVRLSPLQDLKKSYFKHVKGEMVSLGWSESKDTYTADVVDSMGFFGVQAEDMTVRCEEYYKKKAGEATLTVTYTDTNGCKNVITYFTRWDG